MEGAGTEAAKTGMDAVIAAMDTVTQLMGSVWELMTSNPLPSPCRAAAHWYQHLHRIAQRRPGLRKGGAWESHAPAPIGGIQNGNVINLAV